jgi:hypothetical protein
MIGSRSAHPLSVPLYRAHLRRCRLPGTTRVARTAASTGRWVVEIVKRNELHKFVVLPTPRDRARWIVERPLDQPQLPLGARFRALRAHCHRRRQARDDPHHAATPDPANSFNLNPNFPDRLFGRERSRAPQHPKDISRLLNKSGAATRVGLP